MRRENLALMSEESLAGVSEGEFGEIVEGGRLEEVMPERRRPEKTEAKIEIFGLSRFLDHSTTAVGG